MRSIAAVNLRTSICSRNWWERQQEGSKNRMRNI